MPQLGETVLIIDDEQNIRELLEYNLEKEGYSVIPAASGEEGLDLARRNHPALIILDLMLPGIDGIDVCRRLKKDPRTADIPIIMASARARTPILWWVLKSAPMTTLQSPSVPGSWVHVFAQFCAERIKKGSSGKMNLPSAFMVYPSIQRDIRSIAAETM